MTYTTTHLGISTLLVFNLIGKERREYLSNHPRWFFLLSLGAIIPDLDLILGTHRFVSHSLLIPLILLFLASFVQNSDHNFNLRYLLYSWISHMFFDMSFGPMALFWPLDDRLFNFNFFLVLNLLGNFLLPVTIVGFTTSIIPINPNIGTSVFFLNWSAAERVARLGGETYNLSIPNVFLHIVLFSYYLIKVVFPAILPLLKNRISVKQQQGQFPAKVKLYWRKINRTRVLVILFLLIVSLYTGPGMGDKAVEKSQYKETVWSITNEFRIIGLRSFTSIEGGGIDVAVSMQYASVTLDIFALQIDKTAGDKLMNEISVLSSLIDNQTISQFEFYDLYKDTVAEYVAHSKTTSETVRWEFNAVQNTTIIFGLMSWNNSDSFIEQFVFDVTWNYSRVNQYRISLYSAYSLIVALVIVLFVPVKYLRT